MYYIQYCFGFMFWCFGLKICGLLAPQQGMEPAPPALEGEVLIIGPPGKSLELSFVYGMKEELKFILLYVDI